MTLVYQVTAAIIDLSNSDALININFLKLPGASNEAPFFKTKPPTPEIIPCSSDNSALRWQYIMGQTIDPEESPIEVKHECPLLPINFFKVSFEVNSLELTLDHKSVDVRSGIYTCETILTDDQEATTVYQVDF